MDLGLTGKLALVTASTGGIGLEIARSLAREGARVIVNGRSDASVAKAVAEIRRTVPAADLLPLAADCATAAGCAAAIAAHPAVDVLVNNLGIYEAVGFFDETDEAWQRIFDVNIMSGVRLSRHHLKGMLARGTGRVIFISSESGVSPAPEMAHYSATKTMQLSISRSLAELTKGSAVTVNTVMPGSTLTESVQKFVADVFPGVPAAEAESRFVRENRATSLIQRFIRPEEIGDAVAFVASHKASAINGAALRVDGGIVKTMV
ncbi:MAG: oxidoreductase [Phycisphaerales bacterium]|nr:oxidoreductase [Phycisphaerales bacterium]